MIGRMIALFLLLTTCCMGQQKYQLAPPMLKYSSSFATSPVSVEMIFNQPGAEIRYTLNGEEPDEEDLLYSAPVQIKGKRVTLKVKAMGADYVPSETVRVEFINGGKEISQIQFTTPHESYKNAKPDILHDNLGGMPNYGSGSWLGYDVDTVVTTIQLKKKENITSVMVDLLQDENSWIFLPREIILSYPDERTGKDVEIGYGQIAETQFAAKRCTIHELNTSAKVKTDKLKLTFLTVKRIPDWHPGNGKHAWFFIDEIKVF